MNTLITAIKTTASAVIHEFNTVRLPLIEQALGQPIVAEFPDPVKRTAETTKIIGRVLDNTFFRHINAVEPLFLKDEGAGRDYKFGDVPIEDKNTFGGGDTWTGNGYAKTGWHLLKKFSTNGEGRIDGMFLALVNLDECESKWSDKTLKSNFSCLALKTVDHDKIIVILGTLTKNRVNLKPVLVPV
jgi:hypothetical protein